MKSGIVQELFGLTRPTLLKKCESMNIKKAKNGDNIFSWRDIVKLWYTLEIENEKTSTKRKKKTMVMTLCQNKGGVGKTTSVINLGYLFSALGKTLIIDNDSQANLSQSFGVFDGPFLKDFLETTSDGLSAQEINENLFLIPNELEYDYWKTLQIEKKSPETKYLLAKSLKQIKNDYDFIIIDCPPSLDLSFKMALLASNYALIVLDGHPFSLNGLQNIISEISKTIYEESTLDLSVLGVFFAKFNSKASLPTQVIELAKNQDIKVFDSFIRETIQIPESQVKGLPIFEYEEKSNAAFDYFKLFQEIIKDI